MPRQARIDYPGALHHVMVRGVGRGRIVESESDRALFVAELVGRIKNAEMSCLAWAVMPNHAHLLLRTGKVPLGRVMQGWLTRYAGAYNHRHRRKGHLFQNRYKAILCDEESYLLALVRYLHLNPLRAGIVASLAALDRYPWTGHAALMGARSVPWQATEEVLGLFGRVTASARRAYRAFVAEGVGQEGLGDLTGGGLLRSLGLPSMPEQGIAKGKVQSDPRILGAGHFVDRAMARVEAAERRRVRGMRRVSPDEVMAAAAKHAGLPVKEIREPNRRKEAVVGRALACKWLVEDLGLSGVRVARMLGISGAAVTQGVERGRRLEVEREVTLDRVT